MAKLQASIAALPEFEKSVNVCGQAPRTGRANRWTKYNADCSRDDLL
jgi:hypothetical protein